MPSKRESISNVACVLLDKAHLALKESGKIVDEQQWEANTSEPRKAKTEQPRLAYEPQDIASLAFSAYRSHAVLNRRSARSDVEGSFLCFCLNSLTK